MINKNAFFKKVYQLKTFRMNFFNVAYCRFLTKHNWQCHEWHQKELGDDTWFISKESFTFQSSITVTYKEFHFNIYWYKTIETTEQVICCFSSKTQCLSISLILFDKWTLTKLNVNEGAWIKSCYQNGVLIDFYGLNNALVYYSFHSWFEE